MATLYSRCRSWMLISGSANRATRKPRVRQTAPPLRPQLTLSQGIKSRNLDLVGAHSAVHGGPFLRESILYGCDGLIRGDSAIDKMDFALLAAAILEHASFGVFVSSLQA